jgi:hypothetical protein
MVNVTKELWKKAKSQSSQTVIFSLQVYFPPFIPMFGCLEILVMAEDFIMTVVYGAFVSIFIVQFLEYKWHFARFHT